VGECPPGLSRCLTAETSAPSTGTELLANDIVRDIAYKAGLESSSDLYNQHCLVAALSHSK
jgi:hypothetical protein